MLECAALALAIWGMLLLLRVLPGESADYQGVVLAVAGGLVLGATRGRRMLVALLVLIGVVVAVVGVTPLSENLEARWVRRDPIPDSGVAAIVAVSAGVNRDTTMSSEALDHLLFALELIRDGRSSVLVTTAVLQQFPQHLISTEKDQARIVALFGDGFTWIRNPATTSTRQEAVVAAARLLPRDLRRIAVVASPMHTRRACASFEAVGFSVICVPARMRVPAAWPPSTWPMDRMARFGAWVYEAAGMAEYASRGWLDSSTTAPRR